MVLVIVSIFSFLFSFQLNCRSKKNYALKILNKDIYSLMNGYFLRSRTSSVGKVDNSELGALLLDKALYLRAFLDNDHLLSLDYEYGMLNNRIAALNSDTKLRFTKSIH